MLNLDFWVKVHVADLLTFVWLTLYHTGHRFVQFFLRPASLFKKCLSRSLTHFHHKYSCFCQFCNPQFEGGYLKTSPSVERNSKMNISRRIWDMRNPKIWCFRAKPGLCFWLKNLLHNYWLKYGFLDYWWCKKLGWQVYHGHFRPCPKNAFLWRPTPIFIPWPVMKK